MRDRVGQPRSRPPVWRTANRHASTGSSDRPDHALAATMTDATSVATAPARGGARPNPPADAATANSRAATLPPQRAARRSQPRTVVAGTPRSSPIRRWPFPAALASSAHPITLTRSTRPVTSTSGSSECDRCGQPSPIHSTRRIDTPPRRVWRGYQPSKFTPPCPHDGHDNGRGTSTRPAAASHSSTETSSTNTICSGCLDQPTTPGCSTHRGGHLVQGRRQPRRLTPSPQPSVATATVARTRPHRVRDRGALHPQSLRCVPWP
jgi:hypothetical protein